jgi:hypothetical protein
LSFFASLVLNAPPLRPQNPDKQVNNCQNVFRKEHALRLRSKSFRHPLTLRGGPQNISQKAQTKVVIFRLPRAQRTAPSSTKPRQAGEQLPKMFSSAEMTRTPPRHLNRSGGIGSTQLRCLLGGNIVRLEPFYVGNKYDDMVDFRTRFSETDQWNATNPVRLKERMCLECELQGTNELLEQTNDRDNEWLERDQQRAA